MKISSHVISQLLLTVLQVLNIAAGVVPAKYQPFVALGIALVQAAIGWLNHYYNPDGTSSTTAFKASVLILGMLLISGSVLAQTATAPPTTPTPATSTFNVTAAAVTLPGNTQTLAATLAGVNLRVTTNFALHEINLLSGQTKFYGGGVDYTISPFSKWLNNVSPTLNGYNFQLAVTGSLGAVQAQDATGKSSNVWGGMYGGYLNYAINGSQQWSLVGRVEDLWTNSPGLPHRHNLIVAVGPTIHF